MAYDKQLMLFGRLNVNNSLTSTTHVIDCDGQTNKSYTTGNRPIFKYRWRPSQQSVQFGPK